MTCEKCGLVLPEYAIRTHEGRWLCPLHKALAVSMPEPQVAAGLIVVGAIESVADRFAAFQDSATESFRDHERRIGALLALHRADTTTRHAQIDTHETRLAAAEASLGTARDILGDVSTRGDVSAQIGKLAAEIAALKSASMSFAECLTQQVGVGIINDQHVKEVNQSLYDFQHTKTFWQRLMWLLLGR